MDYNLQQMEHALRGLDFFGRSRDYSADSEEARNSRFFSELENPPENFDARQALLDRTP